MARDTWLVKLSARQPTDVERLETALASLPAADLYEISQSAGLENRFCANLEAFAEKTAEAEELGRQMAYELLPMNKAAGLMGGMAGMGAKALGFAAKRPGAAMAIGGGTLGAIGGALSGGDKMNPATGQMEHKSRLGRAMVGGALGAGAGFGASKIPVGGGANIGSKIQGWAGQGEKSLAGYAAKAKLPAPAASATPTVNPSATPTVQVNDKYQQQIGKMNQQADVARNAASGDRGRVDGRLWGTNGVQGGRAVSGQINFAKAASLAFFMSKQASQESRFSLNYRMQQLGR